MAGKRKKVKSTKASRKTLDQIHYGDEPSGEYFKEKDLHAFFNWYSYSYDRARVNQVIVGFAKEHGLEVESTSSPVMEQKVIKVRNQQALSSISHK